MTDYAAYLLELTLPEYTAIRAAYFQDVHAAVSQYLSGQGNILGFENAMKIAISEAFPEVAHLGWDDGAAVASGKYAKAEGLQNNPEAAALLEALTREEFSHVSTLAARYKGIRGEPDSAGLAGTEAAARAEGYARTLDRIYANFKVMAAGSILLTFDGDDGEESCSDCQRYKGKRHRAWWWVRHNAVPPNRDFECGGYKCYHFLRDDQGNLFTI